MTSRIATTAKFAIATGAIAVGALTLAPGAQAAQSYEAFKHYCATTVQQEYNGPVLINQYVEQMDKMDLIQLCKYFRPDGSYVTYDRNRVPNYYKTAQANVNGQPPVMQQR